MTEGPDQSVFIPRRPDRPWEVVSADIPEFPTEQVENLRQHEDELRTKGSEFSHGVGLEPAWVTSRAAREHRYATPAEGGVYHGKSPRLPAPIIGSGRHAPRQTTG